MPAVVTSDRRELHLYELAKPAEPKATVALIFGLAEHGERYTHVAEAFGAKGIALYTVDLRGHGRSPGRRGYIDSFEEYHRDLEALLDEARRRANGGPLFLMGHSMGCLIALDWLVGSGVARATDLRGVVLSSPLLGTAKPVGVVKESLGKVMTRVWPSFAMPTGIKGSDVTSDPEIGRRYETDPLVFKNATARWYTECVGAWTRVLAGAPSLRSPLLLLYAGDDSVVSANATDLFASRVTTLDRTMERLAGLRHEILNEPPNVRGPLIARIADWILARAKPSEERDAASA